MPIHETAWVAASAVIDDEAEVGPFASIGPEVVLGPGVEVGSHSTILGRTTIGAGTRVYPHACLGGDAQNRDPRSPECSLEIGRGNVIREFVTINVGTVRGGGCTRIGDHNMVMNNAHIAHDCRVGSHCIITGPGGLAGHVQVEDHAVLGAFSGVHQFARVGESVMAAGNAMLSKDAPPFSLVAGDRARVMGVNTVGLRRREMADETIRSIKRAFHVLFRSRLQLAPAIARVREDVPACREVEHLLGFLEASERGFCR